MNIEISGGFDGEVSSIQWKLGEWYALVHQRDGEYEAQIDGYTGLKHVHEDSVDVHIREDLLTYIADKAGKVSGEDYILGCNGAKIRLWTKLCGTLEGVGAFDISDMVKVLEA